MPILTSTIGDKKFRLQCFDKTERSYSIQEQSKTNKKVWNTVDTFGIVYPKSNRPFGYLGYSFATAGLAFEHFITKEKESFERYSKLPTLEQYGVKFVKRIDAHQIVLEDSNGQKALWIISHTGKVQFEGAGYEYVSNNKNLWE